MDQQEWTAILAGLVVLVLLCIGGAAAYLFRAEENEKPTPAQHQEPAGRTRGAGRLAAGARRRRMQAAMDNEEEADDEGLREAPQRQRAEPEQKFTRKDAYEERRRRRDEEREAQQLAEEQEAERREAERKAAEDAEAAKWLGQISLEKEGTEASTAEEQEGLLQAFVDYIKERKTVVLEDLAADFGLRVQDVISRVQSLESMERITGVMDDRGKFIYISREEMQAVADFIKRKGRVAISEIAAKSNTLIDLEEKADSSIAAAAMHLDLDIDDIQIEASLDS